MDKVYFATEHSNHSLLRQTRVIFKYFCLFAFFDAKFEAFWMLLRQQAKPNMFYHNRKE